MPAARYALPLPTEELRRIIREVQDALPPDTPVVDIRFEETTDWEGDEIVRLNVVLRDDRIDSLHYDDIRPIVDAIVDKVAAAGDPRFVYGLMEAETPDYGEEEDEDDFWAAWEDGAA